jgi:hypothetical protein
MANEENKLDQYFREKLSAHEEKPSQLVWERLDQQLSGKKPAFSPLLKAAAAVLIIMGFGFILWQIANSEYPSPVQFAEQREVIPSEESEKTTLNQEPGEIASLEIEGTGIQEPAIGKVSEQRNPIPIQQQKTGKKSNETATPLLALNEPGIEKNRIDESILQGSDLSLPELKIDQTIALNLDNEEKIEVQEEAVSYRIIIKSNGLKDEPKKQNIIEGIENNVNKIGAFLGKVEQGFADLQDAKENLFASNTPRKERSK